MDNLTDIQAFLTEHLKPGFQDGELTIYDPERFIKNTMEVLANQESRVYKAYEVTFLRVYNKLKETM
jgi:hypothetical protein